MVIENMRKIKISGGQIATQFWDNECEKSVTHDVEARDKIEEFKPCKPVDTWGPQPNVYPAVDPKIIPKKCNLIIWQQKRVLALIDKFTKKGWNYCHHHTPSFMTPETKRIEIATADIAGPGGKVGVCSQAGISADGKSGWNGIDCTHFTSWIYNYGFGAHLISLTGDQACGPNAPGKIIELKADKNKHYSNKELEKLHTGDILYIAAKSTAKPRQVSHGILWTGIKVQATGPFSEKALMKNVPAKQAALVQEDLDAFKKARKDIYVIADSHNAGPNYRIFAGWWIRAFTHARRLIGEKPHENPAHMKFEKSICLVSK
jgi:hypothetical protein